MNILTEEIKIAYDLSSILSLNSIMELQLTNRSHVQNLHLMKDVLASGLSIFTICTITIKVQVKAQYMYISLMLLNELYWLATSGGRVPVVAFCVLYGQLRICHRIGNFVKGS